MSSETDESEGGSDPLETTEGDGSAPGRNREVEGGPKGGSTTPEKGGSDPSDEDPEWKYICRGCQTKPDPEDSGTVPVDKVREGISSRSTAETLARIHRVLNSGHDPEVMPDA